MSENKQQLETNETEVVAKKSNTSEKKIITFSILGAVLLALIVSVVLVLTLVKEPEEESIFDIWEGEAAFGNAAHLAYPMIDDHNDVIKLEVENESGTFTFLQVWDEGSATNVWRMEEYKDVAINKTAFEMLRMHVCTQTTKTPMRNVTEKQMQDWGVDSSCKTKYTLYFKENGQEKSYTVRIGKPANESGGTYCAYIEGRNHIYKFGGDACEYVFRSKTSYLNPTISTFFQNDTFALLGIDAFEISLTKQSNISPVVKINVNERDDTAVDFKATYSEEILGKKRTTVASTSYLNSVFSTLYVKFEGNDVMAIDPDEETLKKYGLSASDEKYLISVTFASSASFASPSYQNREPELFVSREIDGYYYVLSKYHQRNMIVQVNKNALPFLGEDEYSLIKWTDVTSITTGFFESLCKSTEEDIPGIDKIIVKSFKNEDEKTYNEEVFNLFYDEAADVLRVKAQNSGLEFIDDNNPPTSYDRNWFRNLYRYFLTYPFIYNFNTMTSEEIAKYEKDENIAYSITAYLGDGKVVRYTYYKIDVNLAFEKAEEGIHLGNGNVDWGAPVYDYTSSMTYIRKVCKAVDVLLSGERLTPEDELL